MSEKLEDLQNQLAEVRKKISAVVLQMDSSKLWSEKRLLQDNVLNPLDKQRYELLQKIKNMMGVK